jgi:hypothetical protein
MAGAADASGVFGVSAASESVDTVHFVDRTRESLAGLVGVTLACETVDSIKCYLTGSPRPGGRFGITRYLVSDKHGIKHVAYNAKINIHLRGAEPIFLGLRDSDVTGLEVAGEIAGAAAT